MSVGTYTVALKVFNDNPGGPETDIASLTISATESTNLPPVADAAGPYTLLQGDDLILEGVVSDLNETYGDIVSSAWDLDNDGIYDDFTGASGSVPWSVIESMGLSENTAHEISLMAIDEKSENTYDNTTLTITIATGIDLVSGNYEAVIYPNPVGDMLTIKPNFVITKNSKIRLIDNKGKVMIERIECGDSSELRINISMLSPGIYYVQISSTGFNKRLSFIKI